MQNEQNNTLFAHFQVNETIYVVKCIEVCNALDELQSQGVDLTSARLLKVTTGA
jgi:hypothetical protein